jgi:hypothetical protein
VGLLIFNRDANNKITISNARDKDWGLFPWSPSWGEINFYAYDLTTVEFHNELYGYIQDKEVKYTEADMENFLVSKSIKKNKKWVRVSNGVAQPAYDVTLCTYIRNKIHHPENKHNADYTNTELKESINAMIGLIK